MSKPQRVSEMLYEVFSSTMQREPEVVLEYVVVDTEHWDDFRRVMRDRGFEFQYSIEDAEDGVEYHIHNYLDEAEDVLWAIQVMERERVESVWNCCIFMPCLCRREPLYNRSLPGNQRDSR